VHRIIRAFENDGEVPKVTLLDYVRETTKAWDDAGSTTITNCFRKEGSGSDDETMKFTLTMMNGLTVRTIYCFLHFK
jgi:hypothetical protein